MKIKKALSDALQTLKGPGLKAEALMFLRRYSAPRRPVTNYSCREGGAPAVRAVLDALGFEEGKDYVKAASSLDPNQVQFRWADGSTKIDALRTALSYAVAQQGDGLFDCLYASVVLKGDLAPLGTLVADVPEGGNAADRASDAAPAEHVVARVRERSRRIVRDVLAFEGRDLPPNGEQCLRLAKEYLSERFEADGAPKAGKDAPFVPPLSVIEVFVRFASPCAPQFAVAAPFGTCDGGKYPLLFRTDPHATDLFRLVGRRDRIPWNAMLEAPLDWLWMWCDRNPLTNYMFHADSGTIGAVLEDKLGVFVAGNATFVSGDGFDDVVYPALALTNRGEFWGYVHSLYETAFRGAAEAGIRSASRIGVPHDLDVWPDGKGSPCPTDRRETQRIVDYVTNEVRRDKDRNPVPYWLTAEYAVVLGDSLEPSVTFVDEAECCDRKKASLVRVGEGEDPGPDFGDTNLTTDELAKEWWAMTHVDDEFGLSSHTYTYGREANDPRCADATRTFRARFRSMTPQRMAELSQASGSAFQAVNPSDDYQEFKPLSAFVQGLIAHLRVSWDNGGANAGVELPWKGRTEDPTDEVVTNVYSGVYTDLSPKLGESDDVGEVFPNVAPDPQERMFDAQLDDWGTRNGFTRLLKRLRSGQTKEQLEFAKRTKGTKRRYALVVETNVDCDRFVCEGEDPTEARNRLGTLFLQTMVLQNSSPFAAVDDEATQNSFESDRYRHWDLVKTCLQGSGCWSRAFPDASSYRHGLPCGAFGRGPFDDALVVQAHKDADGRMVLVFVMSGDLGQYARLCYRFRCGLALETAGMRKGTGASSAAYQETEFPVRDSERCFVAKAEELVAKQIGWGIADPYGEREFTHCLYPVGPLFRASVTDADQERGPDRDWFVQQCGNRDNWLQCSRWFA